MCGEKVAMVTTAVSTPGSPPHVRGKELRVETCFADNGITPACAGKSNLFVFRRIEPKDHPPRMRGKGGLGQNARFKARITPAYAGKRVKISLKFRASEDHPRVCGEQFQRSIRLPVRSGSPPRMRGKVCAYVSCPACYRITPAYAGKRKT